MRSRQLRLAWEGTRWRQPSHVRLLSSLSPARNGSVERWFGDHFPLMVIR